MAFIYYFSLGFFNLGNFTSKIFEELNSFDEKLKYAEDIDMYFRTALHCDEIGYVPEPLTVYFQARPGSLTQSTSPEIILENLNIIFTKILKLANDSQIPILRKCINPKLITWIYMNYSRGNFSIIADTLDRFNKTLDKNYIKFIAGIIKLPKFCRPLIQKIIRKKGYGIQQ